MSPKIRKRARHFSTRHTILVNLPCYELHAGYSPRNRILIQPHDGGLMIRSKALTYPKNHRSVQAQEVPVRSTHGEVESTGVYGEAARL